MAAKPTAPVTRLDASPSGFATSQYVLTAIAGGIFTTISFDLEGGMKAGQLGMAYTMARTALRNSARIYLKATGRVVIDPPDDEVFDLLQEADPKLAERAWSMERENPLTEAELRSYIARVVSFYEDDLGIKENATYYRYIGTDREWGGMFRRSRDIAVLLEHLGIEGLAPKLHRFDNLLRERKNIKRGLKK